MKKNWNNFRQTLDKLIYDGTARSGRESDDVVNLFVDNLFHRTMEDRSIIIEEILRKNIKALVHFTPAFNVSGILKYGLIPRKYLEKKPLCNIIESVFPDDNRLDCMMEANCITISYPNYKLFFLKRRQIGKNWAVVLIDPEILTQSPCLFFKKNAASRIDGDPSLKGFNDMFEDVIVDTLPESLRSYLCLPSHYTTDPQAEILINSVIPPKFIKVVYIERWPIKKLVEMRCGGDFKEKIWLSDQYFKPRHDHHYWKRDSKEADNILR